jgi:hypothetical protein
VISDLALGDVTDLFESHLHGLASNRDCLKLPVVESLRQTESNLNFRSDRSLFSKASEITCFDFLTMSLRRYLPKVAEYVLWSS